MKKDNVGNNRSTAYMENAPAAPKVQECDATMLNRKTTAGNQKRQQTIKEKELPATATLFLKRKYRIGY